jgi:hypothetical protein
MGLSFAGLALPGQWFPALAPGEFVQSLDVQIVGYPDVYPLYEGTYYAAPIYLNWLAGTPQDPVVVAQKQRISFAQNRLYPPPWVRAIGIRVWAYDGIRISGSVETSFFFPLVTSNVAPSSPSLNMRWLDTTDRLTWYWDGSHWLSEQIYTASGGSVSQSATNGVGLLSLTPTYNVRLLDFSFSGQINPTGSYNSTTDYWDFALSRLNSNNTADIEHTFSGKSLSLNQMFRFATTLNMQRSAQSIYGFQSRWNRFGNAASLIRPGATLTYRLTKL